MKINKENEVNTDKLFGTTKPNEPTVKNNPEYLTLDVNANDSEVVKRLGYSVNTSVFNGISKPDYYENIRWECVSLVMDFLKGAPNASISDVLEEADIVFHYIMTGKNKHLENND